MALKQGLYQKMQQRLSPQQIQLMKLLQIPTVGLEQRIKEELEVNPALDEGREEEEKREEQDEYDDVYDEVSEAEKEFDFSDYADDDGFGSYKTRTNNYSKDDEEKQVPLSGGATFQERLESQLGLRPLSERQKLLAKTIIGNIDDSGYLRRDLSSIEDDLAFSQNIIATEEELEEVLAVIHDLDPAGAGARDLQECLLLQIERRDLDDHDVLLGQKILEEFFDEFTKKHYDKITKKLEINEEILKGGIDEILKLNPKPGSSMSESRQVIQHVVPDFMMSVEDGELQISLNGRNAPELKVSRQYAEMAHHYSKVKGKPTKGDKDAMLFVKRKIDGAKWFIDAIKQRQNTLMMVMEAIGQYQKAYFLTGDETKLRPMILKDIAEMIGMDISTVSRVANSKYLQSPYGTFLLKSFFSESLTNDQGEEVSTREVKKILSDLIEAEDKGKPLTDEKLAKELKGKGYNIARRTIAKYREQLDIPVARLRREL